MDAAASPMSAAFTNKPDYTPFNVVPNRTSLTLGLSTPPSCGEDVPAAQDPTAAPAPTTATVPAAEQQVAAQWQAWKAKQPFVGPKSQVDTAPPEQMSRFSWYEATGWTKPYPGDAKIYARPGARRLPPRVGRRRLTFARPNTTHRTARPKPGGP